MTEKKVKSILEAMEGITYLEWKKLRLCIDNRFNADTNEAANRVPLADVEKIVEDYKREF